MNNKILIPLFCLTVFVLAAISPAFSNSNYFTNAIGAGGTGTNSTSQNYIFAGPTSGSGAPAFRALVSGDLPGGTGTVTSFSAGNLSPLFTTSVATSTSTPALSFSLSNAAGNSILSNTSGSSGAPAYNVLSITAGTGLSGGGDLTTSPTVSLAVPVTTADGGLGTTTSPSAVGQIPINTTGNTYTPATLTAGTNISITNASGSVTINATSSSGFAYNSETSDFNAVANNAYGIDTSGGTVTATLPTAVGIAGQEIYISLQTAGNTLTINTTSSQTIDGQASGAITTSTRYNSFKFMSNGANWMLE